MEMGRTQWQEVQRILMLWKGWSIDDASWIPADNFTYARELKKMITRDKPTEDTSMG